MLKRKGSRGAEQDEDAEEKGEQGKRKMVKDAEEEWEQGRRKMLKRKGSRAGGRW